LHREKKGIKKKTKMSQIKNSLGSAQEELPQREERLTEKRKMFQIKIQ
jgi:hypothetical protein